MGRTGRPPSYCDDYCQQAALLDRIRPEGEADLAPARDQLLQLRAAIADLGAKLRAIDDRLTERRGRPGAAEPYAEAYRALARAVRALAKRSAAAPADPVGSSEPAGTSASASSRSTKSSTSSSRRKPER
jgi:hypothetical protein